MNEFILFQCSLLSQTEDDIIKCRFCVKCYCYICFKQDDWYITITAMPTENKCATFKLDTHTYTREVTTVNNQCSTLWAKYILVIDWTCFCVHGTCCFDIWMYSHLNKNCSQQTFPDVSVKQTLRVQYPGKVHPWCSQT